MGSSGSLIVSQKGTVSRCAQRGVLSVRDYALATFSACKGSFSRETKASSHCSSGVADTTAGGGGGGCLSAPRPPGVTASCCRQGGRWPVSVAEPIRFLGSPRDRWLGAWPGSVSWACARACACEQRSFTLKGKRSCSPGRMWKCNSED